MQDSDIKEVEYDLPEMQSGAVCVANAWARVPGRIVPGKKNRN